MPHIYRPFLIAFLIAIVFALPATVQASLTVYANPNTRKCPPSTRYSVQARQGTGTWTTVPVYDFFGAPVSYNNELTTESHVAYFDSSGDTQVQVTLNGVTVSSYVVRPKSKSVASFRSGNQITLTMTDATRQVCLEVNGQVKEPLLLFSNPPETNIPSPTDPNVRYVKPGYTDWGYVSNIASNQTVYIAGGAVLHASLNLSNVSNVTIRGHGILVGGDISGSNPSPVLCNGVTNSTIQDIIAMSKGEPYVMWLLAGNDHVTISNVKAFGKIRDGIDPQQSTNITLQDSFIMSHDDNIAFAVHNWSGQPNEDTLLVQRCILAQVAGGNPIRIWGDAAPTRAISDITVTDCDVIYALKTTAPNDYWSEGVFEFSTEGGGPISNVLFDNIRIEKQNKDFVLDIRPHNGGGVTGGGTINNVRLRNVSCVEGPVPGSRIAGTWDAPISNVFLESYYILGSLVTDAASGNITIGAYTSNITYNQSGPANGLYQIVARHSGKALEVAGAATYDGANVDQFTYTGGTNQRWNVTYLGNNQYQILNANSGKSLDVSGASTADGANVQQWSYYGSANQQWSFAAP